MILFVTKKLFGSFIKSMSGSRVSLGKGEKSNRPVSEPNNRFGRMVLNACLTEEYTEYVGTMIWLCPTENIPTEPNVPKVNLTQASLSAKLDRLESLVNLYHNVMYNRLIYIIKQPNHSVGIGFKLFVSVLERSFLVCFRFGFGFGLSSRCFSRIRFCLLHSVSTFGLYQSSRSIPALAPKTEPIPTVGNSKNEAEIKARLSEFSVPKEREKFVRNNLGPRGIQIREQTAVCSYADGARNAMGVKLLNHNTLTLVDQRSDANNVYIFKSYMVPLVDDNRRIVMIEVV